MSDASKPSQCTHDTSRGKGGSVAGQQEGIVMRSCSSSLFPASSNGKVTLCVSTSAATGDGGSIDASNNSTKRKITNISKDGARSKFDAT
eukprot:14974823-Ditylum_brightwellii.AAC.1